MIHAHNHYRKGTFMHFQKHLLFVCTVISVSITSLQANDVRPNFQHHLKLYYAGELNFRPRPIPEIPADVWYALRATIAITTACGVATILCEIFDAKKKGA